MTARWEETLATQREIARELPYMPWLEMGVDVYPEGPGPGRPMGIPSMLLDAEPFYVSDEAYRLWEAAYPQFEPEPLRHEDLIVPNGFVVWPRITKQSYSDEDGTDLLPVRAWSWHSRPAKGIFLFTWSLVSDWNKGDLVFGELVYPEVGTKRRTRWTFNLPTGMLYGDTEGRNSFWQAFWRLTQQFVSVERELPRARRREEMRNGSGRRTVKVLTLRRLTDTRSDSKGNVEWDHRWIVKGHWRNQWYPSLGVHKQIWISPYVKGPEDRPLLLTERVVEFVR